MPGNLLILITRDVSNFTNNSSTIRESSDIQYRNNFASGKKKYVRFLSTVPDQISQLREFTALRLFEQITRNITEKNWHISTPNSFFDRRAFPRNKELRSLTLYHRVYTVHCIFSQNEHPLERVTEKVLLAHRNDRGIAREKLKARTWLVFREWHVEEEKLPEATWPYKTMQIDRRLSLSSSGSSVEDLPRGFLVAYSKIQGRSQISSTTVKRSSHSSFSSIDCGVKNIQNSGLNFHSFNLR